MAREQAGRLRNFGLIPHQSKRFFSYPRYAHHISDSLSLIFNGYWRLLLWGQSGEGMKLTVQLHIVKNDRSNISTSLYVIVVCPGTNFPLPWLSQHIMTSNSHLAAHLTIMSKLYQCFTFMWPCIITNFFITKANRCTNFTNLFWHETPHVSHSSSVRHQEFINCTLSSGICHTGL